MTANAEKYLNTKMDWKDIERLFPDCYVALDDYYTNGYFTTGVLRYVCKTQKELNPILKEFASKGIKLHCMYTTESEELNGLWQL